MIKKVLSRLFKKKKVTEIADWTEVELTIDDLEASLFQCDPGHFTQGYGLIGYTGIPAPTYLTDDPWFGPTPVLTEKQIDYMEQETEIKMKEEMEHSEVTCESHDIHAKMYEIATQNWTTVVKTQGGSENFQEGPDGWSSGTGINQFQY